MRTCLVLYMLLPLGCSTTHTLNRSTTTTQCAGHLQHRLTSFERNAIADLEMCDRPGSSTSTAIQLAPDEYGRLHSAFEAMLDKKDVRGVRLVIQVDRAGPNNPWTARGALYARHQDLHSHPLQTIHAGYIGSHRSPYEALKFIFTIWEPVPVTADQQSDPFRR